MTVPNLAERRPPAFARPAAKPRRLRVLLVGAYKVGKSHAACTFPKPGMLDFEDSADWFHDKFPDLEAVRVTNFADARRVLREIDRAQPFETLVIDGLTAPHHRLLETVPADQRTGDGKPKLSAYFKIKEIEKGFVDALSRLDCNIVCTAWMREAKDERGKPYVVPDYDEDALHAFDFAFHLFERVGQNTRARCIASRRDEKIARGDVLENFSYESLLKRLGMGAAQTATQVAAQPAQRAGVATASVRAQARIEQIEPRPLPVESVTPPPRKDYKMQASVPGETINQVVLRLTQDVYKLNGFGRNGDTVYHVDEGATFDLRRCVAVVAKMQSVPVRWGDFTPQQLRAYLAAPLYLGELRERDRAKEKRTKALPATTLAVIKNLLADGTISEHDLLSALKRFKKERVEDLSAQEGEEIIRTINAGPR